MAEISVPSQNSGALGSDFAASSVGSDLQIHLPVLSARNHKIFVKPQRCVVLFILAFILSSFFLWGKKHCWLLPLSILLYS